MIPVIEVFKTIQGEGPFCCRPAVFVRVAGCNLRCPFCDTSYSWNLGKAKRMTPEIMASYINNINRNPRVGLVVFTGGEPMLYYGEIRKALQYMDRDLTIQFETNGTIAKPKLTIEEKLRLFFVVSPKNIPYSLSVRGARLDRSWLEDQHNVYFKFLARTEEDVREIASFVEKHKIQRNRVYIMPLTPNFSSYSGSDRILSLTLVHRRIAKQALELGFNFSPRMHLYLNMP